jgi:flavin reductase (DIM6/NTAB) family NADH-FMN oxidoreductase RutF
MDADAKKTTLRMIPYGLYVLTAASEDGRMSAATVNWVTQASFAPPLVAVGVKTDSQVHALIDESKGFVLNVIAKGDNALAYTFFKPATVAGNTIGGEPFTLGTGVKAPVIDKAPAHVECKVIDAVKRGDHTLFVGEVVEARVKTAPTARADEAICWLKDLGEKIYYGG